MTDRFGINVVMLKNTVEIVLDNHQIFSGLQNGTFCRLKQAILQCKTGRFKFRNGTYGKSRRQCPFLVAYFCEYGKMEDIY